MCGKNTRSQEIICSILTISKTLMHVYLQITILYYKHLNRFLSSSLRTLGSLNALDPSRVHSKMVSMMIIYRLFLHINRMCLCVAYLMTQSNTHYLSLSLSLFSSFLLAYFTRCFFFSRSASEFLCAVCFVGRL